jgi:hypothetical protein
VDGGKAAEGFAVTVAVESCTAVRFALEGWLPQAAQQKRARFAAITPHLRIFDPPAAIRELGKPFDFHNTFSELVA